MPVIPSSATRAAFMYPGHRRGRSGTPAASCIAARPRTAMNLHGLRERILKPTNAIMDAAISLGHRPNAGDLSGSDDDRRNRHLYVTGSTALLAEHRMIDNAPNGLGDLLSAVFLARFSRAFLRKRRCSWRQPVSLKFSLAPPNGVETNLRWKQTRPASHHLWQCANASASTSIAGQKDDNSAGKPMLIDHRTKLLSKPPVRFKREQRSHLKDQPIHERFSCLPAERL